MPDLSLTFTLKFFLTLECVLNQFAIICTHAHTIRTVSDMPHHQSHSHAPAWTIPNSHRTICTHPHHSQCIERAMFAFIFVLTLDVLQAPISLHATWGRAYRHKTIYSVIVRIAQITRSTYLSYACGEFSYGPFSFHLLRVPNLLGIRLFALLHGPKFGRD